jgi:hypothetical protein
MDFSFPAEHQAIRAVIEKICHAFPTTTDSPRITRAAFLTTFIALLRSKGGGQKIWISTAQISAYAPRGGVKRKTEGLRLVYTARDRNHVEVLEIAKMDRSMVHSNELDSRRINGAGGIPRTAAKLPL